MSFFDQIIDLAHKENSDQGNAGQANNNGDETLGESQLRLFEILVSVGIFVLIGFEDVVVETIMRLGLEEDVDQIPAEQDNSHSARNRERFAWNLLCREVGPAVESIVVDSRKYKTHYDD